MFLAATPEKCGDLAASSRADGSVGFFPHCADLPGPGFMPPERLKRPQFHCAPQRGNNLQIGFGAIDQGWYRNAEDRVIFSGEWASRSALVIWTRDRDD